MIPPNRLPGRTAYFISSSEKQTIHATMITTNRLPGRLSFLRRAEHSIPMIPPNRLPRRQADWPTYSGIAEEWQV